MTCTRRSLWRLLPGAVWPALGRAADRHKVVSVEAWAVPLLPASRFGAANFKSDDDPARKRWFGPFSQLSGSLLVRIRTDSGLTGYGLGGGGGAGAYLVEHHLRDLVVGVNPLNTGLIWEQLHASTSFYGRRGLAIMAISGIDLALWDIAGKAAGKPVHELLGGAVKDKVAVYYTSNQPERGLALGCTAFKLPVGIGPDQGREGMKRFEERVMGVRKLIGEEASLMIDCLALWNVPYTLEMAERLAPYRLRWIEEPLYPDDMDGYEELCRKVRGTKIASGEHEYTRYGFAELIRRRAAHILQPDITWSGGLSELRRIAKMAAESGLPFVPHRGGSVYSLALLLATPGADLAESFGVGEPGNDLMQALSPRFEKGYLYPNTKPGFGAGIDDRMIARARADQ